MPVVVPMPLQGLATEIGTLGDVVAAMEAFRDRAVSDITTGTFSITYPGSLDVWQTITGMPNMSVNIDGILGAIVVAGAITPNAANAISMGVAVDGNTPLSTVAPEPVGNYSGTYPMTLIQYVPVLALGAHTFEIQVMNNQGSTCSLENVILTVIPI